MGTIEMSETPIDQIDFSDYPLVKKMLAWWSAIDGRITLPMDPLSIPQDALPHIMWVELDEQARDATIRLAGSVPCNIYGKELKGLSVFDFFDQPVAKKLTSELHHCATQKVPSFKIKNRIGISGNTFSYARIALPVLQDGTQTHHILKFLEPSSFLQHDGDEAEFSAIEADPNKTNLF
jgi:hypothetical protein